MVRIITNHLSGTLVTEGDRRCQNASFILHSASFMKGDSLIFTYLQETYKPRRRYRKPESMTQTDEETRVRTTLLEYGW